jgi:Zn-finger nucleic acid-binding protein
MFVCEVERIELDQCPGCEGTWFDRGELALLFDGFGEAARELAPERLAELPDAASDEERRRCPICRTEMRKRHLGGEPPVLVDACPKGHGLWFDRHEVAELAGRLAARLPEAPARALDFIGRVFGEGAGPGRKEGEDA